MRFKFPKNLIPKTLAVVLCAALLGTCFGHSIRSAALFDPDKSITYQVFASRTTVEDAVLFIGTYIIHKDALSDDLYQKATDSGSEAGQPDIYYKSEISDGQWFEIGDIDNGIKGLSIEGNPVSIETINPLYVTYYVGSDGILRDAKTMAAINPFDLPDPYDLAGLPELDPIRSQYTSSNSATSITQEDFLANKNSKDSGNLRSDVYLYQLLSTFFSLDLRDSQTNKLDEQLNNLNNTYIALKGAGQDEEAQLVYDLMEMVDATRRAIVMEKLSEIDENLLNGLYSLCSGSNYTPYGNFKDSRDSDTSDEYIKEMEDSLKRGSNITIIGTSSIFNLWFKTLGIKTSNGWWTVMDNEESDRKKRSEEANKDNDDYVYDNTPKENPFNADTALLDAIGDSISNCGESYTTYLSKALVDSDDLLGHVIYDYSSQVIENSSSGSLGGPIEFLKHATNIRDDVISDKDGELALLKSSLLSMGSSRYTQKATAGTNSEYASLTSEGAKQSSLENQKTEEEADRSMFQFLIEAMRKRDTAPNALEYVNERINITQQLLDQIPSDEFKSYSTTSVQAHLVWLKEEAQKIIDSDDSLKSKLDELKDKKKELQKKRDQCLDNNDLAGAKAYDAKIAAVDQDIAEENQKLIKGDLDDLNKKKNDALDRGDADEVARLNAEMESLKNNADANSLGDDLLNKAMSKLADDQNADLSGIAQALADLGATDKLSDLAKIAKDSGASASTLADIQDALNSAGGGKGGSGGSGSGSGGSGSGSGGAGDGSGGAGDGSGGAGSGSGGAGDGSGGAGSGSGGAGSGSGGSGSGSGGSGSGSGSGGSGSGNKALYDADELLAMLEDLLGKSLDEMDDKDLAVTDAICSRLSKSGVNSGKDLAGKITNIMLTKGNKYLYSQYEGDKTTEYISMDTLSNVTSYRYFYDDTKARATMTSGSKIYIFTRGSDKMYKQSTDTDPETMKKKTVFQNRLYMFEDDSDNYFDCKAEYIDGTNCAVCLTKTMQSDVDKNVDAMLESLGLQ